MGRNGRGAYGRRQRRENNDTQHENKDEHDAIKKPSASKLEPTLLGVDAVEHGRVLQHVWQNHEANVAAPQVTAGHGVKKMKDGFVTVRGR
jgi:hypothetical protein